MRPEGACKNCRQQVRQFYDPILGWGYHHPATGRVECNDFKTSYDAKRAELCKVGPYAERKTRLVGGDGDSDGVRVVSPTGGVTERTGGQVDIVAPLYYPRIHPTYWLAPFERPAE